MKTPRHQSLLWIMLAAVAIVAVAGPIAWWQLGSRGRRPMFHNTFSSSDRWPIRHWQVIPPPQVDTYGNVSYVDFDLNLLVVVATKVPLVYPQVPLATEDQAVIGLEGLRGDITVARQRDKLLLYDSAGSLKTFKLEPGEAKELWQGIMSAEPTGTNVYDELQHQHELQDAAK